jgi:hypothetical protein
MVPSRTISAEQPVPNHDNNDDNTDKNTGKNTGKNTDTRLRMKKKKKWNIHQAEIKEKEHIGRKKLLQSIHISNKAPNLVPFALPAQIRGVSGIEITSNQNKNPTQISIVIADIPDIPEQEKEKEWEWMDTLSVDVPIANAVPKRHEGQEENNTYIEEKTETKKKKKKKKKRKLLMKKKDKTGKPPTGVFFPATKHTAAARHRMLKTLQQRFQ